MWQDGGFFMGSKELVNYVKGLFFSFFLLFIGTNGDYLFFLYVDLINIMSLKVDWQISWYRVMYFWKRMINYF